MNDWKVLGRLCKEPWVSDGGKVLKFTIAVDKDLSRDELEKRRRNNEPTADFFPITVFQEYLIKWMKDLKTGDTVLVSCRLQNGTPYTRTNKEGFPEKVSEEQKILTKIEVVKRHKTTTDPESAYLKEANNGFESEEDPIQVSTAQSNAATSNIDNEW